MHHLTRRDFIGGSLAAALAALPAFDRAKGADRLSIVPFVNEEAVPFDTPYGSGLEGRLNTDLSKVSEEALRIESRRFFVRTRFPEKLRLLAPWKIHVDGLVRQSSELALGSLRQQAEDRGTHVIDCAGNTRLRRFGLLSEARWQGVPIERLISKLDPARSGTRVQVFGYDRQAIGKKSSARDASWIFALEELVATGAFLATGMNESPLLPDHGASVRLVVPGWYGCACTKWVDRIAFVDDAVATSRQMKEYASRTNQTGDPELAKDYRAPAIEPAALPVRVEQWKETGGTFYRVVGVAWGAFRSSDSLRVRFHPETSTAAVAMKPPGTGWTLWTQDWKPAGVGTHQIELRIADSARSRRLSTGFYNRSVRITEV